MRTLLTVIVASVLACGVFVNANAQVKFGMGVELMNQPTMVQLDFQWTVDPETGDLMIEAFDLEREPATTFLTPSVLFTIQATPAVFIEPSVGFHRLGSSADMSGIKEECSGHDLSFGLGVVYAMNPDATVSPMVHPMFDLHLVKATYELTSGGETGKAEISTTAFSVGLGIGGLVNLKETLYMTAEARLMFTKVGDMDMSLSPGDYRDVTDTSMSMFDTDMAVGIRFVF